MGNTTNEDFNSNNTENIYKMQCFPLYSILLAIEKTDIDYFSLDVEGSEYKILKTIPWHKVNIKVMYYAPLYLFSTTMFECHSDSHPMIENNEILFFEQKSNDYIKKYLKINVYISKI